MNKQFFTHRSCKFVKSACVIIMLIMASCGSGTTHSGKAAVNNADGTKQTFWRRSPRTANAVNNADGTKQTGGPLESIVDYFRVYHTWRKANPVTDDSHGGDLLLQEVYDYIIHGGNPGPKGEKTIDLEKGYVKYDKYFGDAGDGAFYIEGRCWHTDDGRTVIFCANYVTGSDPFTFQIDFIRIDKQTGTPACVETNEMATPLPSGEWSGYYSETYPQSVLFELSHEGDNLAYRQRYMDGTGEWVEQGIVEVDWTGDRFENPTGWGYDDDLDDDGAEGRFVVYVAEIPNSERGEFLKERNITGEKTYMPALAVTAAFFVQPPPDARAEIYAATLDEKVFPAPEWETLKCTTNPGQPLVFYTEVTEGIPLLIVRVFDAAGRSYDWHPGFSGYDGKLETDKVFRPLK